MFVSLYPVPILSTGSELTGKLCPYSWQIDSGNFAAIVSISAESPKTAKEYHDLIAVHEEMVHMTVQVCD